MLGYIQARGLISFEQQNQIDAMRDEELYEAALAAVAPPKKGKKLNKNRGLCEIASGGNILLTFC